MRQARVFNNVRDVQMEVNVVGVRVRATGMTLIVAAMALGLLIAVAGFPITGVIVFLVGFTIVIRIIGAINAMSDIDATGLRTDLRELTQILMLLRSMAHPVASGDDYLTVSHRTPPRKRIRRG